MEEILNSQSSIECKRLGNEVSNFNLEKWNAVVDETCYTGIYEKFKQHKALKTLLLSTNSKTLGESCSDMFMGTGISLRSKQCLELDHWKGKNTTGKILTRIRSSLSQSQPALEPAIPPQMELNQVEMNESEDVTRSNTLSAIRSNPDPVS